MLDILHTRWSDPLVEVLSVPSPANEIYTNAMSDSLVQYFIYLISPPTGDAYGGQFLMVKLDINAHAI